MLDAVAGLGPLQPYLDDPEVEEIWINEPGRVFVARHGVPELTTTVLTADQVRDLVERMLKPSGRRLDLSSPFVDAMLAGRQPPARRDPRHHARALGGQHPQVRGARPTSSTSWSGSGTLTPPGRRVPRRGGAGRA